MGNAAKVTVVATRIYHQDQHSAKWTAVWTRQRAKPDIKAIRAAFRYSLLHTYRINVHGT